MRKLYYKMPLASKKGMWGVIFTLPWILGFLLFFARPFVETIQYSFSEIGLRFDGIDIAFIGLANYVEAFTVDLHFNNFMIGLLWPNLAFVAIVVIFSLLAAILINGKYPGRSIIRTIFFLPIIMGANLAVATMVGDDIVTQTITSDMEFGGFGGFFGEIVLITMFQTGIPEGMATFVLVALGRIFEVLARSGVPILIFLAGLQAIPASLYEVAKVEGCTMYESFWKVTLPMISPMVLLSTVFTVVDMFTLHSIVGPPVGQTVFLQRIHFIAFTDMNYGLAAAMSMVYILLCLLIIGVVTFVMNKVVFYYD